MWIIKNITDTRSYNSETGKAIAGTGVIHSCDFCGKGHEFMLL